MATAPAERADCRASSVLASPSVQWLKFGVNTQCRETPARKSGVTRERKHLKGNQPPVQQDLAPGACWTWGQRDPSLPAIVPRKSQFRASGGGFSGWARWSICHLHMVLTRQSSPCLCTCLLPSCEVRGDWCFYEWSLGLRRKLSCKVRIWRLMEGFYVFPGFLQIS